MKKYVSILVILFVYLLPFVVDAKVDYELDWSIENNYFIYNDDDRFYFVDRDIDFADEDDAKLREYDNNGKFVSEKLFYDSSVMTKEEFFKTRVFKEYIYQLSNSTNGNFFVSDDGRFFYDIYYRNEVISFDDFEKEEHGEIYFYDDVEITRSIMGQRFDVYDYLKKQTTDNQLLDVSLIDKIDVFENLNVMYYLDDDNHRHIYVLDKDCKFIFDYDSNDYNDLFVKEIDGLLYVATSYNLIDVYKLDGTKIKTITIDSKFFDKERYPICGNYEVADLLVFDNQLFISLYFDRCPTRMSMNDANDFVKLRDGIANQLFLKYSLDYEISKVGSSDGDFTYDLKYDDEGREYVELKITPKKGYSIDKIIVTDLNGKEIEVKDNKFYMPMNAVNIEIKYVNGEYVPIPNTALNSNVTFILISIILIGLGIYVMNFVKREEK